MIKKLGRAFGRSVDFIIIATMVVATLAILIQFGLRPNGVAIHLTFYLSLIVLVIMMVFKIVMNFRAIERERLLFFILNVVSCVVMALMACGLHFEYFGNGDIAVGVFYASYSVYIFTSLCLL